MMTSRATRVRSEQGATLVHVAVALVVLMGMLAYTVDRGIAWIGRGQAQNAADAGALAGATARGFDETGASYVTGGIAERSALTVGNANNVWGTPGSVEAFGTCPPGIVFRCVKVNVYRNGENGSSTLPVIFSPVIGVSTHGVKATATAVARAANATDCLRPFAIPDRWVHGVNPPETYNHWNGMTELSPRDGYPNPGRGYSLSTDLGDYVTLTLAPPPSTEVQQDRFQVIQLPGGANSISNCIGTTFRHGDYVPLEPVDPSTVVAQGISDLIGRDSGATFDTATMQVENSSCVPTCGPFSPRIIPIPVYDTERMDVGQQTGVWSPCLSACIRIVQFIGFFVDSSSTGSSLTGNFVRMPGELAAGGGPPLPDENSFLITIRLIR